MERLQELSKQYLDGEISAIEYRSKICAQLSGILSDRELAYLANKLCED